MRGVAGVEREPEDQKHTGNFSHECRIFVHNIVFLAQNNVIHPLRKNHQMSKYLRLKLEKCERQPSLLVKTSTLNIYFLPTPPIKITLRYRLPLKKFGKRDLLRGGGG